MSDLWKRWVGQVIDHKYQLRKFCGSTDHSAVFGAEYYTPELRTAAVKFMAADLPHAEQVLEDWKRAQKLAHDNLLTIYSVGRCTIDDHDLIYAAMEYADENLAEILPQRALTADEAREMLSAVVEVLVFLHINKLTHGHIKPSNILAIGDRLKVSSDTIEALVEAREMRRKRDVYDAPEVPATAYTPAADIWSLGVTLVETLTQQPAFLPFNENAEPVIAPAIREPLREIATNALRRDPKARWTALDIASKLNPEAAEKLKAALAAAQVKSAPAVAATTPVAVSATAAAVIGAPVAATAAPAASASAAALSAIPARSAAPVSPLAVPLSKEPPIPLGKQPTVKTIPARPTMPPPPVVRAEKKQSSAIVLPNYVVPVLAVVLIVVAFVALPKILRRETVNTANAPAQSAVAAPKPAADSAPPAVNAPASQPAKSEPDSTAAASNPPVSSAPPVVQPTPAVSRSADASRAPRKVSGSDHGEVLDKVMPKPAGAALASIEGTVRVVVRVHVDAAGNVAQASLEKPGPSRYFADLSLKAAKGWVFLSPGVDGHSLESEWLIRFDFRQSGADAYPQQVSP